MTQSAARRENGGMEGLPKVWCSDLQPALEMLGQGVITRRNWAHRLCETCFPGDAGGIAGDGRIVRDTALLPLGRMKEEILKRVEH